MMNDKQACAARASVWLSLLLPSLLATAAAESQGVVGKKISDFTAEVTSVTYHKGKTVLNLESKGDIGSFGTVQATATFKNPIATAPATGVYSARGASFRPDGSVVEFTSKGGWHALGGHRWEIKSIGVASDGGRTMAVAVLKLGSMTMKGTVYELD